MKHIFLENWTKNECKVCVSLKAKVEKQVQARLSEKCLVGMEELCGLVGFRLRG